jgi:hypothetical protein
MGLVALGGVMYLAAAPGGAARQSPPLASAADDEAAVARSLASPPARQHLVLLVDDPVLGAALQRRILAGEFVAAEFGAYASPFVVEVVVAADAAAVTTLEVGLREFEASCVAEACPAIRILDLRAPRRSD